MRMTNHNMNSFFDANNNNKTSVNNKINNALICDKNIGITDKMDRSSKILMYKILFLYHCFLDGWKIELLGENCVKMIKTI